MKAQKKSYVTIKNLPDQIKAGTLVTIDESSNKWLFNLGNSIYKICIFDPSTNPEFFKEVVETKYKKGDVVYVKEKVAKSHRNLSAKVGGEIIDISTQFKKIRYTINQNNIRYTLSEDDIYKAETYYFINSSGQIHEQVLTDEHRKSYAYSYRIATNNVYKNRKTAQDVIDNLDIDPKIMQFYQNK